MKNKRAYEKGITLVALVVTIIILLILAGITISTILNNQGIVTKATKASKISEVASLKEQIEMANVFSEDRHYKNTDEVNEILKSEKYKNKIGIYRDQLTYLIAEDASEEEVELLKNSGFNLVTMNPQEFKYYIEMSQLEDAVNNSKEKIGRELFTSEFNDSVTIGTTEYSNGWHLIGNYSQEEKDKNIFNEQFDKLGLKDTTHQPYIVNYETKDVLSVDGMVMYKSETLVHTFKNLSANLAHAITYVDEDSKKTEDYYGNLYSTKLYTGPGSKTIYQDNNGSLQYDMNNNLLLDNNNAMPVLENNQKYKLDDIYSVNVTVECNINQSCGSIVALSDVIGKYIAWLRIAKGYIKLSTFSTNANIDTQKEEISKGYVSKKIDQFADKDGNTKMNIQIIAKRNDKSQIYINGEKFVEFESGDGVYSYKYTTLGDLRVGRNLKFVGKIYNFGLYSIGLSDNDIQENYKSAETFLNAQ